MSGYTGPNRRIWPYKTYVSARDDHGQWAARTGGLARMLEQDLSNTRAVYRLVALCGSADDGLQLQIYVGEADSAGTVNYRSGSATFLRNALVDYRGLSLANSETFWFQ